MMCKLMNIVKIDLFLKKKVFMFPPDMEKGAVARTLSAETFWDCGNVLPGVPNLF